MPIYEYKCEDDHVTEQLELTSKKIDSVSCPQCGKLAFKQISQGSWRFAKKDDGIRTYTP